MPITYRCEFCNQRLSISRKMAGLSIPCPRCGESNRVPEEDAAGAPPKTSSPPVEEPTTTPAPGEGHSPFFFAALDEDETTPPVAEGQSPESPSPIPDANFVFSPAQESPEDDNYGLNEVGDAPTEKMPRDRLEAEAFAAEPSTAPNEPRSTAAETRSGDDDDGQQVAASAPTFQFRKRGGGDEDEMDLTPMVDMTFLLLIFFMITASFTLQKSLPFPAPSSEQKGAAPQVMSLDELEDTAVIVRIDEKNQIFIEEEPLPDRRALTRTLRNVVRSTQRNEVVVSADDAALHETVVAVIDAANDVGVERIRMTSRVEEM